MTPVRLAVLGAGLIGRRHIEHVAAEPEAELMAVVDPSPAGEALAAAMNVRWTPSFAALLADGKKPDGVIVATPNRLHVTNGLESVAAGVPALVEKPIADDVRSASELVEAAEAAGVPLLVGHHRRHNPIIRKAKEVIDSGRLGRVVAVHGSFWLYKPDDYFEVSWRREKGGGPVLLNLIHDVDSLRYLCGEVEAVQACRSSAVRGHDVEDTAALLLRFANGALGTISVSDTIVAPWSWEMTSGENPAYPRTGESCYHIGGTEGALTIPHLDVWRYADRRSWWEPIQRERVAVEAADPLAVQVRHFCRVIRGEEEPLATGREGLNTLRVVLAVKDAAESGRTVHLT